MKIAVKYLLLVFGLVCTVNALVNESIASAIASTGLFIAYALIEIQDIKTRNSKDEE